MLYVRTYAILCHWEQDCRNVQYVAIKKFEIDSELGITVLAQKSHQDVSIQRSSSTDYKTAQKNPSNIHSNEPL